MKARRSRFLVVDACVAQSAGETEHPASSSCRNVLISIRDICHHVVMTQAIQEEWNRHTSRFTRKWFRSMVAKKKVQRPRVVQITVVDGALRMLSPHEQEMLQKDLCLIEAACDSDGIVVTRDDTIVRIWQKCQDQFGLSRPIKWINPVTDDIQIFENL